jgi:hypothetical protein
MNMPDKQQYFRYLRRLSMCDSVVALQKVQAKEMWARYKIPVLKYFMYKGVGSY